MFTRGRQTGCGVKMAANARRPAAWFFLCLGITAILLASTAPLAVMAGPPRAGDIHAAPLAAKSIGERFGVASSHIKLYDASTMEAELDAVSAAGMGWVRCDFAWFDLETTRGQWNFTGVDRVVREAQERGIKVLGILGTSPPWANGGKEWNFPPTDTAAWRNYVRTVAARYRGKVAAWEIWNEQNIHAFWQPEPDAAQYMVLLAAASREIRAADPGAKIVMGGVAGLGSGYLHACLGAGAADYIDAIAYHPYAETIGVKGQPKEDLLKPKESLCRLIVAFVHNLVAQHTAKDLEIWLTEVGWTTCAETPPGVDANTQASYLLRTMINYASTDVERVIWYNLRDTMLNDWDRYGLLEHDYDPRPSYRYYSTFCDVFGPAVAKDESTVSFACTRPATLEAHVFRLPDGSLALAAWKSDDLDDSLTFSVNDASYRNPVSIDPLTGAAQPTPGVTRDASGKPTVTGMAIGKTPVMIRLDKVAVSSITPNQAYQLTIAMAIDDLAGSGFQPGAAVRLEMDGKIIQAYGVNVVSPARTTCIFGFFGAEPGVYDVVVANPDGSRARLDDGFRVISPCGAGGGTALLALGLTLGLISAAGTLRLRRSRRGKRG